MAGLVQDKPGHDKSRMRCYEELVGEVAFSCLGYPDIETRLAIQEKAGTHFEVLRIYCGH
jgi:hypothetical protein